MKTDSVDLPPMHPAAGLFPLLEGDEFEALVADVKAHGLLEPVWMYDDPELGTVLLDGRNRWRACHAARVPVERRTYQGDDPIGFSLSLNVHRRHLTTGQRAAAAFHALPLYEAEAAARMLAGVRPEPLTTGQRAAAAFDAMTKADPVADLPQGPAAQGDPEPARRAPLARDRAAAATGSSGRAVGQFARIAKAAPELAEQVEAGTLSLDAAEKKVRGAHVGHNGGENEWYTPQQYIASATTVMGGIDLDPASSQLANGTVKAEQFYSEDDDGLTQIWKGRLWMNPPYAQPLISQFCEKLAADYLDGAITEAVALVNNATETGWFQDLAAAASAVCFPRGRIKFWHPDRVSAPLQGQAFVYLGPKPEVFVAEFAAYGFVGVL